MRLSKKSRRTFLAQGVATIGVGAGMLVQSPGFSFGAPPSGGRRRKQTVDDDIGNLLEAAELSLLFRGRTAAECLAWQRTFRTQLNQLLGDSTPPKSWKATELSRWEQEDHVRLELLLEAKETPSLPLYLLLPKKRAKNRRAPGVLCVHGHGEFGNEPVVGRRDIAGVAEAIEKANYDYGLQFVRRGYVVAAPCLIPFGRRVNHAAYGRQDPCAVTFVRMQASGRLLITENLRDLRWTLDLLQSRSEVERDQLGCAGLSYGGRMTMLVAAIDQRIRAAAVSGALNLLQERLTKRYSCGAQIIPGLLKFGDYSEIGSLIAPRPCVWETGSTDSLIVPQWDELFRSRLRRVYQALHATDRLQFDQFEGGHAWSGRLAFPLFKDVLQP